MHKIVLGCSRYNLTVQLVTLSGLCYVEINPLLSYSLGMNVIEWFLKVRLISVEAAIQ